MHKHNKNIYKSVDIQLDRLKFLSMRIKVQRERYRFF